MNRNKAFIKKITSYLPTEKLTNEQLAEQFGEADPNKIFDKTGVAVRGVVDSNVCSSDLGVAAAENLFESGVCSRQDIDFLFLCTQSPDYFLPTTACLMHDQLGLRRDCGAIDYNQGCSGYVYGLALAKSLIDSCIAENVLLITAETYTKFINKRDRTMRTLFGDGAAATLIGSVDSEEELMGPFIFGTDGSGAMKIIVPAGGMRRPYDRETLIESKDEQGNWRSACNLHMEGSEVYSFTLRTIPLALNQLLQKSGKSLSNVNYFIPHQANKFLLERLRAKMQIPIDKFHINLEKSGNTVSSTIPIALENAKTHGQIKAGDTVALIGFGVGFSWAATLIKVT